MIKRHYALVVLALVLCLLASCNPDPQPVDSPYFTIEGYEITAVKSGVTLPSMLTLPEGLKMVGDRVFDGRSDVVYVVFPKGYTDIHRNAFNDCQQLMSVQLPSTLKRIESAAFWNCCNMNGRLIIPDSVTYIGVSAFSCCSSITEVWIGCRVKTIDSYAFNNCTSLTDIYFNGTRARWNRITKGEDWNKNCTATIHCSND